MSTTSDRDITKCFEGKVEFNTHPNSHKMINLEEWFDTDFVIDWGVILCKDVELPISPFYDSIPNKRYRQANVKTVMKSEWKLYCRHMEVSEREIERILKKEGVYQFVAVKKKLLDDQRMKLEMRELQSRLENHRSLFEDIMSESDEEGPDPYTPITPDIQIRPDIFEADDTKGQFFCGRQPSRTLTPSVSLDYSDLQEIYPCTEAPLPRLSPQEIEQLTRTGDTNDCFRIPPLCLLKPAPPHIPTESELEFKKSTKVFLESESERIQTEHGVSLCKDIVHPLTFCHNRMMLSTGMENGWKTYCNEMEAYDMQVDRVLKDEGINHFMDVKKVLYAKQLETERVQLETEKIEYEKIAAERLATNELQSPVIVTVNWNGPIQEYNSYRLK